MKEILEGLIIVGWICCIIISLFGCEWFAHIKDEPRKKTRRKKWVIGIFAVCCIVGYYTFMVVYFVHRSV